MANPQLEARLRQRVAAMGQAQGWSPAIMEEHIQAVLAVIDAAAWSAEAQAALPTLFAYYGIQEQPATPAAPAAAQPLTAGGGAVGTDVPGFMPAEPTRPVTAQQFPVGGSTPISQRPIPGTDYQWVQEPSRRVYDPIMGEFNTEPGRWERIKVEEAGGIPTKMRELQYLLGQGVITEEEYQARLRALYLGAPGGGGMTAYQQAQLGLAERRLGGEEFQRQIQAAQAAQPLSWLAMLRGQVPGAGGTDIYQGLRPVVPTLAGQQGAPGLPATPGGLPQVGGQPWQPPQMPPAMATVQRGAPLGQPSFPQGTMRTPGLQAQARMTPFETGAMQEGARFQGIPPMDWLWRLEQSRRAVGPGLAPAGYGGRR